MMNTQKVLAYLKDRHSEMMANGEYTGDIDLAMEHIEELAEHINVLSASNVELQEDNLRKDARIAQQSKLLSAVTVGGETK